MKKYIKKVGVFALLAALLAWFSPFGATAAAPAFDATGVYVVAFNYLGTDYAHDMVLAQDGLGNLTGNGGSPSGANTYTWVVTSGSVSGNAIDFFADYTATPDAVVPQTTMHVTGTIAPNGSMSGNWTDNYQGGARGGTWMLTSGAATPFLIVDDNGAECPGAAYTTIQAAVNAASPGGTITVCAGTYNEHVSVNKALTLNGANSGIPGQSARGAEAIVDGADTGAAFAVTANDVAIDGFTVKNGSDGGLYSGIWVQTGTQNLKIANNIITQNGFGVWAQCGGNCLIENNLFDGNNKAGPGNGGISADNTTGLSINNNEFKNHNSGNPILLQAVGPGAHNNVSITNNNFHDNTNASVMYILAVSGGVISGNTILPASDVTGISLSGANTNVDIHHNVITGGIRGVRVEDAGYYGGFGGNSNITVNRNNVSGNSVYGVGNTDAAIANLDATCNWWGAADGPGPVGAGSGSPVTTDVDFSLWLTSSDLNGLCNGVPPPPVTVTIAKYVDGVHANVTTAENESFPMSSCWDADNIGAGCGSFSLSSAGFNNPNPYEATTASMTSGADYSVSETFGASSVGETCADGKPFAFVSYTWGDSEAEAAGMVPTSVSPSLTNITTDKFIIVWNKDCTPKLTVTKVVVNDNGGVATISDFPLFIDNATTTSGTAVDVSAGPHVVSENNLPGYTSVISGDCDAGGNVSLAAGESKECVITNDDVPPPVTVTIVKYVNGVHATAGNANSASFPMNASWDADNIGAGNGSYPLSTVGFNNPNPYEATTAQMTNGADYSTQEDLSGPVVGSACGQGKPFALLGYSVGDTLVDAENAGLSLDAPELTGITSNKYIIVWNQVCPAPVPAANACAAPLPFGWTQVNGAPGDDDVTIDPFTKFVGNGGNDKVKGLLAGDYIVCTGGGNDTITLASGNYWVEAGNGKNTITTGTGDGTIKTGTGADTITTGGGNHTINAGNGNNVITTGSGNDNITTGTGRDVINAGGGNNVVVSGSGNDIVTAGSGNDNINGGLGFDICQAGGGTNTKSGCEL